MFLIVNTVECEEIAVAQGIDALPTFQFFKDGKQVGEFKGSDSAAVEKEIRSYM
jgi:thioredoxin-like negative regulator of GroEL